MKAKLTYNHWSEWMVLAQGGDEVIYRQLLEEVALFLRKFLSRRYRSLGDSIEDIIQETLLAVHSARKTYDKNRSFVNWLLGICQYKAADHFRALNTRMEMTLDNEDWEAFGQEDAAMQTESDAVEAIRNALEKLPEAQKKIVTKMKLEGFSSEEVANEMKISEASVRVSAHRAYQFLRKALRIR